MKHDPFLTGLPTETIHFEVSHVSLCWEVSKERGIRSIHLFIFIYTHIGVIFVVQKVWKVKSSVFKLY